MKSSAEAQVNHSKYDENAVEYDFEGTTLGEFLEYYNQLPLDKQESFQRIRFPYNRHYNIINDEIDDSISQNNFPDKLNLDMKHIHYDESTGKFFHANVMDDYYYHCKEKLQNGGKIRDSEIIDKTKEQKLFFQINKNINLEIIEAIMRDFKKWLCEGNSEHHSPKYELIDNKENTTYEIRFTNVYVANHREKIELIQKFATEYEGAYENYTPLVFKDVLSKTSEKYEKAMSVMHHLFPNNLADSVRAKNIIAKWVEGKKAEGISITDDRMIIKLLLDYAIISKDEAKNGKTNITINFINNHGDNVNMIVGDNNKIITKSMDENEKNINDFIQHIKNDKPDWYTPGKFIPKILFTHMFNQRYNENKSTRNVLYFLKKSGAKDEIMLDGRNCRIDLSAYGMGKKTYDCFLANSF